MATMFSSGCCECGSAQVTTATSVITSQAPSGGHAVEM